jgi:hypothetical protein
MGEGAANLAGPDQGNLVARHMLEFLVDGRSPWFEGPRPGEGWNGQPQPAHRRSQYRSLRPASSREGFSKIGVSEDGFAAMAAPRGGGNVLPASALVSRHLRAGRACAYSKGEADKFQIL